MIDLCIDARMAFSSGIGTCIRAIAPYLNHPPFRTILLVDRPDQAWCKGFEQIVFDAPIYSIKEQLLFSFKIPQCDLFWSPHYNIPLFPIRSKKRIVTIHDACHLAFINQLSIAERLYANTVMHRAFHKSDVVITDSQFSKSELHRFLGQPRNEINVIPVAVNKELFQKISNPNSLNQVKDKYQLPTNFILFVGNPKRHKNLTGLIEAFSKISLPKYKLVIIGNKKGLRNSIAGIEGENVLFIENVPEKDLPAIYNLAEILVFPSFYEGFGLPPLEAMSCGCPTIVSNAASIPEVCGDASIYIHPERIDEMTKAIENLALDQAMKNKLILSGFERIKKFDWEFTSQKYRDLFEKTHHTG